MANHRADGRAQVRKLRVTGGTHRDAALPASAVKVGVLGALATATIAAPLAAAAAGVDEGAELPQAAAPAAPAAPASVEPVALPAAQLDDASGENADGQQLEAREADTDATRDQERATPASAEEDAEKSEAQEAEESEESDGTGIEVEVPEPEPEPEAVDEAGAALPQNGGGYVTPVNGPMTSGYGYRTHPVLGTGKMHEGVDFGVSCGTPVKSVKGGTVVRAGYKGASGNRVDVDHGNGVVTGYYHLQGFATSVGATVESGEVIGYVGSTGRSTGCHLHFAKMDEAGNYSNPMSILR